MIDESTVWTLAISLVIVAGLVIALGNQRRRAKRIHMRFREMEGEEERMFTFLHDLGLAIGREPTDGALSRMIVDGVLKVVGATGGAIYYPANDSGFLIPAYVSENCPPLAAVPDEVMKKAGTDARALGSHLRLARVGVGEGVIGEGFSAAEALHIADLRKHSSPDGGDGCHGDVAVMVSQLRYAGMDIGVLAVANRHADGGFSKTSSCLTQHPLNLEIFNQRVSKVA